MIDEKITQNSTDQNKLRLAQISKEFRSKSLKKQNNSETISFPRTQMSNSQKDLQIDSSIIDEAFRIEFSSSSNTSAQQVEPKGWCHAFIQAILCPCFVILCSFLIRITQKFEFDAVMIDPIIGILTAISLCITFYPQARNTFLILMQTIPQNVNINQLKRELLDRFKVIQNIHEFHIWLLTGSTIVATCHIIIPPQNTHEYSVLFEEIRNFLQNRYGIKYITVQPEFNTESIENKRIDLTTSIVRRHSNCLNRCLVKCPCDVSKLCQIKSCCSDSTDDIHRLSEIVEIVS